MKLKTLTTAMAVAGFSVSTALAAPSVNAQLNYLQAKVAQLEDQVHTVAGAASSGKALGSSVTFDRALSAKLVGWQNGGSAAEINILDARAAGAADGSLFLGGALRADVNYSNEELVTANGAPYIAAKNTADTVSSISITAADLMFMATINDWTTSYMTFAGSNGNLAVNEAYVLFGDLKESPLYVYAGKKVPTFGNFRTYNYVNKPYTAEAFQPAAVGTVGLGYRLDNVSFAISAMNGGNSTSNLYTKQSNKINNTAFDVRYNNEMNGINWTVGLGYLHGAMARVTNYTATNSTSGSGAASTGTPSGDNVAAWDFNAELKVTNFSLKGEYVGADKKVGSVGSEKSVYAYDIGAKFDYMWMGRDSDVYAGFGAFHAADKTNTQAVLGVSHMMNDHLNAALEYANHKYEVGIASSADHFNVSSVTARFSAVF